MKILLIAATEGEIAPLRAHLSAKWKLVGEHAWQYEGKMVTVATTGVGAVATTYVLTKLLLGDAYDLVIQAGIAGAYNRDIKLGEVVMIATDKFADMGAEDHDKFIDVFEMGLTGANQKPFENGWLPMPVHEWTQPELVKVKAITVNTVSGNNDSINRLYKRYGFEAESMEGAAFHYVCLMQQVPFMQVRAISNYIEPRDKSKWKIKEAVIAINHWAIRFLESKAKA